MDHILIAVLMFAFLMVPVGIGMLLYAIPKKLGYPKTAKYLTMTYGALVLLAGCYIAFEDQFFTKNDAKALVEEQQINLSDEFDLVENKTMAGIGDYYHTFTLEISMRDKRNAILKIKGADNYKTVNSPVDHALDRSSDRYFGPTVVQNYETRGSYVREYFKPSGRKGYAPTFRRISISKIGHDLMFEDIDY